MEAKSISILVKYKVNLCVILVGKNYDSSVIIFKGFNLMISKANSVAKSITNKTKNQIIDPLKLFNDNYNNLNKQFLSTLK